MLNFFSHPIHCVILALFCAGCSEVTYPFRNDYRNAAIKQGPTPPLDLERAYIKERQKAAKVDANGTPQLGIALSGGGIRSATFNLGVLQGLESKGLLKQADYLSCVSGGGYIGSWYVSHLRTPGEKQRLIEKITSHLSPREREAAVRALDAYTAPTSRDLLGIAANGDVIDSASVNAIRDHRGLLSHGSDKTWRITRAGWRVLWTFPINFVQDFALHLKPVPGKWNGTHPNVLYRKNLEDAYYHGWSHHRPVLSEDVNQQGSTTPYFISCAALGNAENDTYPLFRNPFKYLTKNSHFEFAPGYCGSPLTGWIATSDFYHPVSKVDQDKPEGFPFFRFRPSTAQATQARVMEGGYPGIKTRQITLGKAMAASGAAVDARMFSDHPMLMSLAGNILTMLNLNLRLLAPNSAQDRSDTVRRVFDRSREMTWDRFSLSRKSNTLLLTDGGHFDNLGIHALAQRKVPWIMAFDATCDPNYNFSSLRQCIQELTRQDEKVIHGNQRGQVFYVHWRTPCPPGFESENKAAAPGTLAQTQAVYRFDISTDPDPDKSQYITSRVIYTKACVTQNAMTELEAADGWLHYLRSDPKGAPPEARFPFPNEVRNNFPHIGTSRLTSWGDDRFAAYRSLGVGLAIEAAKKAPGGLKRR